MDKEIYLSGLRRIVNTHEVETQLFARLTSKNDSIILESGAYVVDDTYYQDKQMTYDDDPDHPFTTIWLAERNRFCGFKSLGHSSIPKCLSSKLTYAKHAIRCI